MRFLARGVALVLAACAGPPTVKTVSYDDRYGEDTKMDVYLPAGSGTGRPGILMIHGGGWTVGSKLDYQFTPLRLADSGYVTASINYRLAPGGRYPSSIQDSWCSLSYLRAHADEFGVDPNRIAAMGYSAGGHLVSMLGVSAEVDAVAPNCASGRTGPANAVVSGAGVQDLTDVLDVGPTRLYIGGGPADMPEAYATASPLTHVKPGQPPFLLIAGTQDWFVSERHSERMRDAQVAAGNHAELLTLPLGGHVLNGTPGQSQLSIDIVTETPEAWSVTVDFLDRTIGPRAP